MRGKMSDTTMEHLATVIMLLFAALTGGAVVWAFDHGFISGSGVMRGHEKTPPFMTGMKCLPHRHVLIISAANNCIRPMQRYIY
jgi:hypothetical protein